VCLQETKKEAFDRQFLNNFCPSNFDAFECLPSVGASGGILVIWRSSLFCGHRIFSNQFGLSMEFTSLHNDASWVLTCVYGPSTAEGKVSFLNWLKQIEIPNTVDWIILGDFNLIRREENRNKPGGIFLRCSFLMKAISLLGLNDIPLQGRKYTWSNMQHSPLLVKLDWVFTSECWTVSYPSTTVKALDMAPSDHTPCLVSISTSIPRSKVFRFENFWLLNDQFAGILSDCWTTPMQEDDCAKIITAKFKHLRRKLKEWQASRTGLKTFIKNTRSTLQFLEVLGEYRDLSIEE